PSSNLEDVFESLDTEDEPGRCVRQIDRRHVLNEVDARTGPHVATDIFPSGKQRPKVRKAFLAIDLIGAEFEDRGRAVKVLGHQAAQGLVVVAHRRSSSLSRAGTEGRSGRRQRAQTAWGPPRQMGLGRIIERSTESVKPNAESPRSPPPCA